MENSAKYEIWDIKFNEPSPYNYICTAINGLGYRISLSGGPEPNDVLQEVVREIFSIQDRYVLEYSTQLNESELGKLQKPTSKLRLNIDLN